MAKVIKLTDNGNVTMLPITDSAYVQHRWKEGADGTTITSVQDALNYNIDRVDNLSGSSHSVQALSYTAGTGIVLSNGGDSTNGGGTVQVEGSGLIQITGTNNKMVIGTTANNYSHPTNGANKSVGPVAGKILEHGNSFVVPRLTINNLGHVTSASDMTYTLPAQYEHFSQNVPNISNDPANKDITGTTGVQEVLTGITIGTDGHVTSYTKTKIYSTDTNTKVTATSKPTTTLYVTGVTGTSNQQPGYDSDVFLTSTAGDLSAKYFTYSTATGDKALYTDASKRIHESTVTKTELEYLSGSTSNIQTQINNISNAISTGVTFKGTWSNGTLPETASSSTVGHMWTYIGTGTFNLSAVTNGNDAEVLRKGDAIIGVNNGTTYYWCAIDNNADIATSSVPGLVKSATTGTTANRDYNVEVNADGTMKVNVPWIENGPDYGQIKVIKHSSLATDGISSSTSDVTLSAINDNELVTFESVNKWLHIKGTQSSTAGSDKVQFSHALVSEGTATTVNKTINLGDTFKEVSYTFDAAGHRATKLVTTYTISAPSTQTVYKSVSLSNNTPAKYVEIKSDAEDLNSTWLSTIGSGSTSYYTSSCTTTNLSVGGNTCTAYVKTA